MLRSITIGQGGRSLDLQFDLSPDFISDNAMAWYFSQGIPPEPEVTNLLFRALRPGDIAVDGGANVGFFTVIMSKLVGEKGKVFAIEPGSNNLDKLRANLFLNACGNVDIVTHPLAARVERTSFYLRQDSGSNSTTGHPGEKAHAMETTTLDLICGELTPRLVKLDIEGSERAALQGATNLIMREPPFIVCEANQIEMAKSKEGPLAFLEELGNYDMFVLHETGQLPSLVPLKSRIVSTRENANILFSSLKAVSEAWPEVQI